jgi:hypothetical protein
VTAPSTPSRSLAPQIRSPLSEPEQKKKEDFFTALAQERGKKLPISSLEDKEQEKIL